MSGRSIVRMGVTIIFLLALFFAPAAFAALSDESGQGPGIKTPAGGLEKQIRPTRLGSETSLQSELPKYVPGEVIVKLKEGKSAGDISSIAKKHQMEISQKTYAKQKHPRLRNIYNLRAGNKTDIFSVIDELRKNDAVEYAEPNYISYTQFVPNDSLYPQQWSHQNTQAEPGWNVNTGAPGVVIAVVDTGVFYNHPDLSSNIWHDSLGNAGRDFVDIDTTAYINAGYQLISGEDYRYVDNDPIDYNGHGTHVAGIAAATGNNSIGVSGVCPHCSIMPVRAGFSMRYGSYDYGLLEDDDIANAIYYAADNGARVISMSFGGSDSQLQKDALDYADSRGVVLIAGAGNGNADVSSNGGFYPAGYDNVLAVAATTKDDVKASYSNYGPKVDVAAPGGDGSYAILSTVPTVGSISDPSGYKAIYGTSMATPYVSGLAGLVLSKNPVFNNKQVMQAIRQGVDLFNVDIPDSQYYIGTGRVNVYKTLQIDSASTAAAAISSPGNNFISGSNIDIYGSTTAPYRVLYGAGIYPKTWTEIASGQTTSGILATLPLDDLSSPYDNYTIKLAAQDEQGTVEDSVRGQIGKQFLAGWPRFYSLSGDTAVWNSPNMADINNDGFNEIIVTGKDSLSRGMVTVLKPDGTVAEGNWPQTIPQAQPFECGAAAGDINNDGSLEIVASVTSNDTPGLMVWDRTGQLLWSKVLEPGKSSLNVTLADINDDGFPEIITQTYNSTLYALDHTGAVLWSYYLNEYDNLYSYKNVSVVDLDGDRKKEIAKNLLRKESATGIGGSLVLFNSDGTVRWKKDWPEPEEDLINVTNYNIFPAGSPIAGDINADGSPEILVKLRVYKRYSTGVIDFSTRFYAFDRYGAVLPGWPVLVHDDAFYAEMALADLNSDGYLELIGSTRGSVHVITYSGSFLFPSVAINAVSNISIADVTGDGNSDIVVFDGSRFHVIEANGTATTLPVQAKNAGSNVNNMPILTDLNKDGKEDLIFVETGERPVVWAWDLQVPHDPWAEQWTRVAFDSRHTGSYQPVSVPASHTTTQLASSLNPSDFGQFVTFTVTVTDEAAAPVRSGVVQFTDGLTTIGTGTVSNGIAVFGTSSLAAGDHTITAEYKGDSRYAGSKADLIQTVSRILPVITWADPAPIRYGTALGAQQLNAAANVNGTFVYTPAAGTILNIGTGQVLQASFTPDDIANYYAVSASVKIDVLKAAAEVSLDGLSRTYDGTSKAVAATTNPAGLAVSVTYDGSPTPPRAAGTYTVVATVSDDNYEGSASGTMVIARRNLTVTATGVDKVYDGTTTATVILNDDCVAGDSLIDSYTEATFENKRVGINKTVTVTGISISGTDADNYTLTSTTITTTADILKKTNVAPAKK